MKVIFSKYAKQELEDAVDFYETEFAGLGIKFKREVKEATIRVIRHPEAWSIERGEIRKYILHHFPFKLLYSIENDHIFVIAVAHQHRKPEYWIDRHSS